MRGVELIIDHQLEAANLLQEGRCQDIAAFLLGREVEHLIGTKRCRIGHTEAPLPWDLAGAAARPERLVQPQAWKPRPRRPGTVMISGTTKGTLNRQEHVATVGRAEGRVVLVLVGDSLRLLWHPQLILLDHRLERGDKGERQADCAEHTEHGRCEDHETGPFANEGAPVIEGLVEGALDRLRALGLQAHASWCARALLCSFFVPVPCRSGPESPARFEKLQISGSVTFPARNLQWVDECTSSLHPSRSEYLVDIALRRDALVIR